MMITVVTPKKSNNVSWNIWWKNIGNFGRQQYLPTLTLLLLFRTVPIRFILYRSLISSQLNASHLTHSLKYACVSRWWWWAHTVPRNYVSVLGMATRNEFKFSHKAVGRSFGWLDGATFFLFFSTVGHTVFERLQSNGFRISKQIIFRMLLKECETWIYCLK